MNGCVMEFDTAAILCDLARNMHTFGVYQYATECLTCANDFVQYTSTHDARIAAEAIHVRNTV